MSRTKLGFIKEPLSAVERDLITNKYYDAFISAGQQHLFSLLKRRLEDFNRRHYYEAPLSLDQFSVMLQDGPLADWKREITLRCGRKSVIDSFNIWATTELNEYTGRTEYVLHYSPSLELLMTGKLPDFHTAETFNPSFAATYIRNWNADYAASDEFLSSPAGKINALVSRYVDDQITGSEIGRDKIEDHSEFVAEITKLLQGEIKYAG